MVEINDMSSKAKSFPDPISVSSNMLITALVLALEFQVAEN